MKEKRIRFIINPISGDTQKRKIVDQIHAELKGILDYDISFTEGPGHATELAKKAIQEQHDAVIAVGGDGTVNEVGKALINSNVALGIIPSGSGNGFARHLKIPLVVKESLACIASFKTRMIDTGIVNGHPFLATTGTGFDSHVAHKFATFGKRGFLAYMQVSTAEYVSYQSKKYIINVDGRKIETDAFVVVVANTGQYGNNVWIAPSASVSDGLLNIGIFQKFPTPILPDIILRLFNKTLEKSRFYKKLTGKEIIIEHADHYHIDGEPMNSDSKLSIQIMPSSLKVIC